MYFRARSMPVNPQTSLQVVVRDAMTQLVTRWGDLTEEQRQNWQNYAANVPWQNKLGDTIKLTGNQMYTSSNTPRIQAGLAIIDDAPTLFSVPSLTGAAVDQAGSTPFAINLVWTNPDLTEDDVVLIYASIAKSPSINFFKGPYRFNTQGPADAGLKEMHPNPTWVTGQRIFVRAQITMADGRLSSSWRGNALLAHTPI
jgi:hypothetical protein